MNSRGSAVVPPSAVSPTECHVPGNRQLHTLAPARARSPQCLTARWSHRQPLAQAWVGMAVTTRSGEPSGATVVWSSRPTDAGPLDFLAGPAPLAPGGIVNSTVTAARSAGDRFLSPSTPPISGYHR